MKQNLIILLSMLLLIGCNTEEKRTNIGIILPLTGDAALFGKPMQNSISLYKSIYLKDSDINLIFEDDKAIPASTINAYYKLRQNNCKIFLGTITSSTTLALAPIIQKDACLLISPSSSSPEISSAGDNIFRVEISDEYGAMEQARLLVDSLDIRNISIVYINNDYGVGVVSAFKKTFQNLGGEVVESYGYAASNTDFRTILLRIKNDLSDNLLIVAQNEFVQIIKQMNEMGVKKQIITTPVFQNQKFIDELGIKLTNGIIYSYYGTFNTNSKDSTITRFVKNYKETYNEEPGYYAALAYDAISVLVKSLHESRSTNIDTLKYYLYKTKNFPGVTGSLSFNENGDVIKPVILKIVLGGNFTNYKD